MSERELPPWAENRPHEGRFPAIRLKEVWACRELIYFFSLRDLKVRYKQTLLGVGWVVLQPLIGALSFTFVFNGLAGIETRGSYFVFALTGFVLWNFFTTVLGGSAGSLLDHEDLITQVSFPFIAAPMSTVTVALVDLGVGTAVAVVAAVVEAENFSPLGLIFGLPLGILLAAVAALGPGLYFAPAIVKYRDAGAILGLQTQLMFFLGPVAYPPELLGERWQSLLYLNPITGSLALFRWGLTSADAPAIGDLAISAAVAIVIAFFGLRSFRQNEHMLVDVI